VQYTPELCVDAESGVSVDADAGVWWLSVSQAASETLADIIAAFDLQ